MHTTLKLRTSWLTAAAATAALALAAGCIDDTEVAPAEPTADEAQAITVPAGEATTAALGIERWRYIPTEEGMVVRGLGAGDAPRARFWISAGETPDEMIARAADAGAEVTILREGGVRGSDEELRGAVTAFRTDVEAAQAQKGEGSQEVNDHVVFCPGSVGTFGTWAFWVTTTVAIDNPSQSQWLRFSFQAGAGYEELWVPPAPYSSIPWLFYYQRYGRQWWGLPVTIRYQTSWPDGNWGPCRRVSIY